MQERASNSNKGSLKNAMVNKTIKENAKSSKDNPKKMTKTVDRCYNCDESGHRSGTCKFKDKGKKCFKCNTFGHESKSCPDKSSSNNTPVTTNV